MKSEFQKVPCLSYCRVGTWRQTKSSKLNCLIYARSATVETDPKLTSQVELCRHLINSMAHDGWVHTSTITEPGISGTKLRRPGLLKALAAIKNRSVDVIVTTTLDRLSRDRTQAQGIIDYIEGCGGRVFSVFSLRHTETTEATMRRLIQTTMAELEAIEIRKRIRRGIITQAVAEWEKRVSRAVGKRETAIQKLGDVRSQKGGKHHE